MRAFIPTIDPDSKTVRYLGERLVSTGVAPTFVDAITPDSPEFSDGWKTRRRFPTEPELARHKWAIILTYERLFEELVKIGDSRVLVVQEDSDFSQDEILRWMSGDPERYGVIDLYAQRQENHFCPGAFELDGYESGLFLSRVRSGVGNLCDAFKTVRRPGPDVFWPTRKPGSG